MPNKEMIILKNSLGGKGSDCGPLAFAHCPLLNTLKKKSSVRGGMKGWNLVPEAGVTCVMQ